MPRRVPSSLAVSATSQLFKTHLKSVRKTIAGFDRASKPSARWPKPTAPVPRGPERAADGFIAPADFLFYRAGLPFQPVAVCVIHEEVTRITHSPHHSGHLLHRVANQAKRRRDSLPFQDVQQAAGSTGARIWTVVKGQQDDIGGKPGQACASDPNGTREGCHREKCHQSYTSRKALPMPQINKNPSFVAFFDARTPW